MQVLAITLIIIVIMFFVIILTSYYKSEFYQTTLEPMYKYSDIKPRLKTGDIMLFVCINHSTEFGKFVYYCRTKLVGSDYGHVGLVIRDGNDLFLVESTDTCHSGESWATYLNDKCKGGVRIINLDILLEEYVKDYNGFFGVKFISKEIPNNIIMPNVYKHRHKIFEKNYYLVLLMLMDYLLPRFFTDKFVSNPYVCNKIYCSELVYKILYDCNVLKKYKPKLFWPNFFTQKIFDDLQLVTYSPVYSFDL